MSGRERILAAAVRRIAREGIDGVRIARIAMDAAVSPALVHYHFATREALLAEALDYSYNHAEQRRISSGSEQASSHAERLDSMLEGCLPTSRELRDDWLLWVELWHQAARNEQLRPIAGELYSRLHAWFAGEIAAGVTAGEFSRCDPDEVADRILALLDGVGVRAIIGDPQMSLARARQTVRAAVAQELGVSLGEPVARGRFASAEPAPEKVGAQPGVRAPRLG
ncbi:MAG TPA: TetR/AcrR family transcriptional regulator [Solirubrobacteraceae bacterium]|nr:TetR/AcrR family transcriptional regulator [Solirubrobacteraceae bacterium]